MVKKISILLACIVYSISLFGQQKPNIVLIYADDLGYGDVSAYGATKIQTPNIDKLAHEGLTFINAHATSATCTPSRFSLLTGTYAWRQQGTGIAPGNAPLLVDPSKITLPSVLQRAGYVTAAVGKWHLGLGAKGVGPDWNNEIKPGPLEIGFDYAFLMPATTDRVPCVYVENHRVVNLDPKDPIVVDYTKPIHGEPVAKEHPELLKMLASHGHDQAIVNGIGRIGYMSGGKSALWVDDEVAQVLTAKAQAFIRQNQTHPFFLYFATHDIHVPRVPNAAFVGKSGMGPRGDAILQLDWTVGQVVKTLDSLGLTENTLIIFSSDNGPVQDDGYQDSAVLKLNGHTPAGPLRGGKYSAFDAGTRIPFIVKWPAEVKGGTTSTALFSQVDLLATFAAITGEKLTPADAPDSYNALPALTGKIANDRPFVIEHADPLSIIRGNWKYIEPNSGAALIKTVNIESGDAAMPQLYNLSNDIGEKRNLYKLHPTRARQMAALLAKVKAGNKPRQ